MRDWKGQADMKWLNQSVHTQSWCEVLGSAGAHIFVTCVTRKWGCSNILNIVGRSWRRSNLSGL